MMMVWSALMSLDLGPETQLVVDPRDAAESAGLRYVSDDEPGLRRRKTGKGFSYLKPDGKLVRDEAARERIRKLALLNPARSCPARSCSNTSMKTVSARM